MKNTMFEGTYTLESSTNPNTGLEGKVVTLASDADNHILCIENGTVIWQTSSIKSFANRGETVGFETQNSVYKFSRVEEKPIPADPNADAIFKQMIADLHDIDERIKKHDEESKAAMQKILDEFEASKAAWLKKITEVPEEEYTESDFVFPDVTEESISREIRYGDGYTGVVCRFDEEITYEDFLKYCKLKNYRLDNLDEYAWYQDHAKVSPEAIKNGGVRHNAYRDGSKSDKSRVWTWLWVRAYTD